MNDEHRVEALGQVAWDALQRIVEELLSRRPGGYLVEADLQQLELRLPLELRGVHATPARFARQLVESLEAQIDEAVQHAAAFRPGRAYCHRCRGSDCEHAAPPSCRHVFTGFGSTGLPRWGDFAQFCLERKLPEVDRLYSNPPAFLTLVQTRDELHGEMLGAFRNESCELLGQVTAGFFPLQVGANEGRGVLALTLQAVASRLRNGTIRPGLNLLGRGPAGELSSLWQRHEELPWRRAVLWAQSALATLPRRICRADESIPRELEQRVHGILSGLARRLERDRRARSRRTRHAEQRHASGRRPTRKAIDDALAVAADACLFDPSSETVVILGPRGRTHFFTRQGRLVSSVRYSRDAIARKIKIERWRAASTLDLEQLRETLVASENTQAAAPASEG